MHIFFCLDIHTVLWLVIDRLVLVFSDSDEDIPLTLANSGMENAFFLPRYYVNLIDGYTS